MSSSLVQLRIDDNLSVQVHGIPFDMQLSNENSDSNFVISAMKRMSDTALKNGISEMTLDEINAEIDAVRQKQA